MKYKSPHTNKKYLKKTISSWCDEGKVNVCQLLLEENNATIEGEIILIQLEGKNVDIKKYKYND